MKNADNFNIAKFCAEQMLKDDLEMATLEGVARIKLGYAQQYNRANKNSIDRARLKFQKQVFVHKVINEE